MKATIVFACATVLGMIFAAAGAESEAEKASERPPCLIYRPEDRDRIRKRLHFERGVWNPTAQPRTQGQTVKYLCEAWSRNYEETLKRHGMTAEGGNPGAHGRSNAMVDVALLVWIEPSLVRPYEPNVDCTTALERAKILDYVRIGVEEITVPKERNRDFFPDPNGRNDRPGDWGHFLDAGVALWNHALAYDLLRGAQAVGAELDDDVLQEYYVRIADGIFHLIVEHVRTYPLWHNWGKYAPLAIIGIAGNSPVWV